MALAMLCHPSLFFGEYDVGGQGIHMHTIQPTYPDVASLPTLEKWRELLDANRDVKAALNYRVR